MAYLSKEMETIKMKQVKILEITTTVTNLKTHQMDLIADGRKDELP